MIFISLENISSCFRITSLSSPTKGTASLIDSTTVQWTISELGVTESEGAVLEFTVQHLGTCSGIFKVNESISYDDASGNIVTFPSPEIDVRCIKFVLPEDLDVSGTADAMCNDRSFHAKFIANYIDSNFECCHINL